MSNMSSEHRLIPYKDATVTKTSSSVSFEENILGNKPHETVQCQFKIKSVNVIAGACSSDYIDASAKCEKSVVNQDRPLLIEAILGFTSVTEVDRLIDLCLTKLIKSEVGSFSIQTNTGDNFEISLQLVDFEDNYKELFARDPLQLIQYATNLKADGVRLFKEKRINDAFRKFGDACKLLVLIDPKTTENSVLLLHDDLLANLRNNLAGCHVLKENWLSAISLCNSVLEREENVKARYRRGISFLEIQEYEKARLDFNFVMEKEPNNSAVISKLAVLDQKEKCLNVKYATAMKKMFN